MKVLVTGGAGYIGSHTVRELLDEGHAVIVYDDLSHGHREAVDKRAEFILGSTADRDLLDATLNQHAVDAVIHFAANIEVAESVERPLDYYTNNLANSVCLLQTLLKFKVPKLVFSSTAAVYGNPEEVPITEDHPLRPINPYGRTKLMVESILADCCRAHAIGCTVLRYFNVGGASPDGTIGEDHHPESHLIPRILLSIGDAESGRAPKVQIFGSDYPTPDGTCVRDFVHVVDLAKAHVLALAAIKPQEFQTFNIGSQAGFSVKEVIKACQTVTGIEFDIQTRERRSGDPAILIADSSKIQSLLHWRPHYPDLQTIVDHSWNWHKRNPQGYRGSN